MKKQIEETRSQWTLKSMKFNRFIWQRYSLAFFFFTNLQWWVSNVYVNLKYAILPSLLLIVCLVAIIENFSLMNHHRNHLQYTRIYCWLQLVVNVVLIIGLFNQHLFQLIFPFFGFNHATRMVFAVILFGGILISLFNIFHLKKIKMNKDKSYLRINELVSSLNGGQNND